MLVEPVAQVRHRVLPRVGHERRREVGGHPLQDVEDEDHDGDPSHVLARDEGLVEDRLHLRDEERPGRGVAGGREPGQAEPAPVGPREREEPPEEGDLLAQAHDRGAAALAQPRPPAPGGPGLHGHAASQGDRGERDDLISLAGGDLSPSGNGTVYRGAGVLGNDGRGSGPHRGLHGPSEGLQAFAGALRLSRGLSRDTSLAGLSRSLARPLGLGRARWRQPVNRYFTRVQRAGKPSLQEIFFPSL